MPLRTLTTKILWGCGPGEWQLTLVVTCMLLICDITPVGLLQQLHCLPVKFRINYFHRHSQLTARWPRYVENWRLSTTSFVIDEIRRCSSSQNPVVKVRSHSMRSVASRCVGTALMRHTENQSIVEPLQHRQHAYSFMPNFSLIGIYCRKTA